MPFHEFFWTSDAIRKIEDHGLTVDEVEYAVLKAKRAVLSRSSGRFAYKGRTPDGTLIFVPFEVIDSVVISVVTAYPLRPWDEV